MNSSNSMEPSWRRRRFESNRLRKDRAISDLRLAEVVELETELEWASEDGDDGDFHFISQ